MNSSLSCILLSGAGVTLILGLNLLDLCLLLHELIVILRGHVLTWNRLLVLLQGRFHLKTLLQVVKCSIFEPTVADKVIKLVSSLYDVQVEDVVQANDILLLQNSNVPIDV